MHAPAASMHQHQSLLVLKKDESQPENMGIIIIGGELEGYR